MPTLSFNGIGLEKFRMPYYCLLILTGLSLLFNIYSTFDGDNASLEMISAACDILSLWPWYWMMTKLSASLMDETIRKRIQWVFGPILIGQIVNLISLLSHQDWLMAVGGIAVFMGYAFYFSIGVRCIRFGVGSVKKFGNYLVYITFLLNFVILCVFIAIFTTGDVKPFVGATCILIATCFVWPLGYALDAIKRMHTDTIQTPVSQTGNANVESPSVPQSNNEENGLSVVQPLRLQKLQWTNNSVWMLLALVVLTAVTTLMRYTDHPVPFVVTLLWILGNGVMLALLYRFFEALNTSYPSVNKSGLTRWFLYFYAAIILIGVPSVYISADYGMMIDHLSTLDILRKINGVLNLIFWGIAAKTGWDFRRLFKGVSPKLNKLGTIILVFSIVGILESFFLFKSTDRVDLWTSYSQIQEDFFIALVSTIIASLIAAWIVLWPVRIMVKLLRNGEGDWIPEEPAKSMTHVGEGPNAAEASEAAEAAEALSEEPSEPVDPSRDNPQYSDEYYMAMSEYDKESTKKMIWIIIGVVLTVLIAIVAYLKFHDNSNSDFVTADAFAENVIEGDDYVTEGGDYHEANLINVILNKPFRQVDGLNVRFFKGEFINGSKRYPIMMAFCESPDDAGHICGIAYKNLSQGTILDMDGMFSPTSMQFTGYDGNTELEIVLSGVKNGESVIIGHATYGSLTTSVELWSTGDTFRLPESIKLQGTQTLPDWLSLSVLKTFGQSNLGIKPGEYMRDLFRSMSDGLGKTGRFEGTMNENPIVFDMKIDYDGKVTGRYALKSSPSDDGDVTGNWISFHGDVLMDSDFGAYYVILEAKNPHTEGLYEYILLEHKPFDEWSGKSFRKSDMDNGGNVKFSTVNISLPYRD